MTEIAATPGQCIYWRGCSQPVVRLSRFCAAHRVCIRCGNPPPGGYLTRGMCATTCYHWWRRHKSAARAQILIYDRARSEQRSARRKAAA